MMKKILLYLALLLFSLPSQAITPNKEYTLWYTAPAPNRGKNLEKIVSHGFPYDADWERWSLALGNGYMGAAVFGRTDTERIQLSEKTLGNASCYKNGGFTNFAEIYLDFHHDHIKNYRRTLSLNKAISTVDYDYEGTHYSREYFANYPSNVIAIQIRANHRGKLNFEVRSEIPYLKTKRTTDRRFGKITTSGQTLTLEGKMEHFDESYEAQIRVMNQGGEVTVVQKEDGTEALAVKNADSAVLLIAAGTSYRLNEKVFLLPPLQKFQGKENHHPHQAVSQRIEKASRRGFEALKEEHLNDYQALFNRVDVNLTPDIPEIPTDSLLHEYRRGKRHRYFEELFFQYGRYTLIASSRPGSLPPNLQGVWTQYDYSPWSGGYWHNVNIQMNYWPVFNTNLAELFDPFVQYNEAYRKAAEQKADEYILKHNPSKHSNIPGENGWTIGCGASAFGISAPGGHSGPGTGGFTTKLFWDYYDFTRDEKILKEHSYPALEGMAKFLIKTLKDDGKGHLLVAPSFSPEQMQNGKYCEAVGCTFDQGMIWENFNDLLNTAHLLKIESPFIQQVKETIPKLDPILVGADGQLKEFREENRYGEIGQPHHRHISHLCTLYPGTLVNNNTPEWMEAARISLQKRSTGKREYYAGWPMAHRMNVSARLKDGKNAYRYFTTLLSRGLFENLWGICPPFQVDCSLGGTAGVAEMLLQSHEGYLYPLPALPEAWKDGSYKGLVARGNFVVSVNWKDYRLEQMEVTARKGGVCRIYLPEGCQIHLAAGKGNKKCAYKRLNEHVIEFNTRKNHTYRLAVL